MTATARLENTTTDLLKTALWRLRQRSEPQQIGLILGCQRSGTNMVNDAFARDWSCKAYGEDGGLALGSQVDHHLRWRWRPLHEVAATLRSTRAPLLIAKPIVESQRALELLDYFPTSRIIWVYRHYLDVAQSSIVKFGSDSSVYNLRAVLDPSKRDHWYSQNLSDETRDVVAKHFDPLRPLPDLKALGWYVRNSLFFQFGLHRNPRVILCKYEKLVANPVLQMQRLYRFLDAPFPGPRICDKIHQQSVQKGGGLAVASEVRELCDTMLRDLDAAQADKPG